MDAHAADPVAAVLLGLVALMVAARVGAFIAIRCNQPAVLGELLGGVLLGNLPHVGVTTLTFINTSEPLQVMAGLGVILLLFEVGIETDLGVMMKVGLSSLLVAIVGVIAPAVLGFITSYWLVAAQSVYVHIFVGTILCATSVGITARVFRDLKVTATPEARIVLGAAVIDDVLGLIILAVVSGMIAATAGLVGTSSDGLAIAGAIALKAGLFLVIALVAGTRLAPLLFRLGSRLQQSGVLLACALVTCFALSYLAGFVGLAPIVGAFAAGLIIDATGFERYFHRGDTAESLSDQLLPIAQFFGPIFFVTMGMKVDLGTLADPQALGLALALTAAGVVGKQVCGLGAIGKGLDRLTIGIAMIPRGEVGLIFAAIGSTLLIDGKPVVGGSLYAAIVIMVMFTTMLTPPLLKWSLARRK